MLRRLLALLLLFALATPAVAMSGHCEPVPELPRMAAMHGGGHEHAPTTPERRDCVGCVLPLLPDALTIQALAPLADAVHADAAAALVSARTLPETPPPRA